MRGLLRRRRSSGKAELARLAEFEVSQVSKSRPPRVSTLPNMRIQLQIPPRSARRDDSALGNDRGGLKGLLSQVPKCEGPPPHGLSPVHGDPGDLGTGFLAGFRGWIEGSCFPTLNAKSAFRMGHPVLRQ